MGTTEKIRQTHHYHLQCQAHSHFLKKVVMTFLKSKQRREECATVLVELVMIDKEVGEGTTERQGILEARLFALPPKETGEAGLGWEQEQDQDGESRDLPLLNDQALMDLFEMQSMLAVVQNK